MNDAKVIWKETPWVWAAVALAGVVLTVTFGDGLQHMVSDWSGKAEYSYGYLVPFIVLFLIWQKADVLCIDNRLCQHGRLPYRHGVDRRVFISIGTPFPVKRWTRSDATHA